MKPSRPPTSIARPWLLPSPPVGRGSRQGRVNTTSLTTRFAGAGIHEVIEALPAPNFRHLRRMTDHVGLWEHARYTTPRPEHGYCTDDKRGLSPCSAVNSIPLQSSSGSPGSIFGSADAALLKGFPQQAGSGRSVGRRDRVRRLTGGRAIWSLGSAARLGPEEWMRRAALGLFQRQEVRLEVAPSQRLRDPGGLRGADHGSGTCCCPTRLTSWASVLHLSDDPGWPAARAPAGL